VHLGLIYLIEPPPAASLTKDGHQRLAEEGMPAGSMLEKLFPHGMEVKQNLGEAAKWNRLAAEAGVAEAQARFGHQLALGLGVDRDYGEAERWFRAAAEQGETSGEVGLGVFYAGGYGNEPDYARAIEWLTKASNQGNASAHYWLGRLTLHGNGTARDPYVAVEHLKAAAKHDHLDAMYLLGLCLWGGASASPDSLPLRACCGGRRFAASGSLLRTGEAAAGADTESVEAAAWLRQAADAGIKERRRRWASSICRAEAWSGMPQRRSGGWSLPEMLRRRRRSRCWLQCIWKAL